MDQSIKINVNKFKMARHVGIFSIYPRVIARGNLGNSLIIYIEIY